MSTISFENIEEKFQSVVVQQEYLNYVEKVKKAKKIYFLGNGGLHYVASHAATDMSRLIPNKAVYSFDSVGFITSNANDYGYANLFVRWLETMTAVENSSECLIVGLSCSGNSSNVINALHWANEHGFDTTLVAGQKSTQLHSDVSQVVFECKYFHTVEILCMMSFYDLVYRTGNPCPTISGEKARLKDSDLRNV